MKRVINDRKRVEEIISKFSRTTEDVFNLEELRNLLLSGRQLKMKYGVDVTAAQMHIGHAVNLWMYRELQELGHKLVFLIGDFTTQIGDPTGKSTSRRFITPEEIKTNAEAFIKQAMLIVHSDRDIIEIRRNSEWFDVMTAKKLLELMRMVTHERLASRDMFRKRIQEGKEIYMHEMVYPIIQGYDSCALEADLTIVGTDQIYNEMLGRFYQEKFGQVPQVIMATKITPGIDGREKQSKSVGNYIGLDHTPREKFGRTMSIPDNLIIQYLQVYTDIADDSLQEAEKNLFEDPMRWKLLLAEEIVKRYHGPAVAIKEREWFQQAFRRRKTPDDAPVIHLGTSKIGLFNLLRGIFAEDYSNSKIRTLIQQGAVRINGQTVKDITNEIVLTGEGISVKIGKKSWYKVLP